MKATAQAKARIVTRAILKMLSETNLPRRVIEQAYSVMAQAAHGHMAGVAEFLRANVWRCQLGLRHVVKLTADLVA